jgi:signal transduction histidine kinase
MGVPLRALFIDDSEDDVTLQVRLLSRAGYDVVFERVDCPSALTAALSQKWRVIFSDYSMPQFTGADALRMVRDRGLEVPFLFVSGTMGEETAVAALKNGAQDYLMKTNLSRLIPAVQRELREAEERKLRRGLEKQIHQLQRFEAIGRLAGGVAHDFNNVLGVITGYSEMLLDKLNSDPKLAALVTEVLKATERGASLTKQLLAFSRQQVLQPRVIDIQEHIKRIEDLLRRVLGEDIRLSVNAGTRAVHLRADPAQLEQVIMNLVVNARDAMPSGGKLTLEISRAHLDADYCKHAPDTHPGHYVCMAVTDTGCGMSADVLSRIFEPFFTTKETGKGTGLGLATVYGIVKQSGGHITVYSEMGHGTTFKVYLPLSEEAASKPEIASLQSAVPGGTETILLVEDEDSLREVTREYISNKGYTVLVASDADTAVEAAKRCDKPIDLLLTDVILPGSSGVQLAQRLTADHPRMRVLYVSGYTADAIVPQGGNGPNFAFLSKPFSLPALTRKIRSILDGDQAHVDASSSVSQTVQK